MASERVGGALDAFGWGTPGTGCRAMRQFMRREDRDGFIYDENLFGPAILSAMKQQTSATWRTYALYKLRREKNREAETLEGPPVRLYPCDSKIYRVVRERGSRREVVQTFKFIGFVMLKKSQRGGNQ